MDETSDASKIGVGNDDLDLQTVLAAMKANNVILLEVHSSTSSSTLWNNWVNMTSGGFYLISSSGTGLANAIIGLVNTSGSNIATLSLTTVPTSYASWVSTTPESYTNVTIPSGGVSKSFAVTVTPPAGTLPGIYSFKIQAIADGGLIGGQNVSITVTGVTGRVVKIQTNHTIAAVGGTKEVPVELINGSDMAGGTLLTPTEYDGKITVGAVECGLNGDLNGNGILDTGDATLLLRLVVGLD